MTSGNVECAPLPSLARLGRHQWQQFVLAACSDDPCPPGQVSLPSAPPGRLSIIGLQFLISANNNYIPHLGIIYIH